MALPSVFLELNEAQLKVVARVLGPECSAVQIVAEHHEGPVVRYAMVSPDKAPPDVHTLYAVPIPGQRRLRIHLTEEQKAQLQCAGVKSCDYVEVEPVGLRYGIVVPQVLKYGMPPPHKA